MLPGPQTVDMADVAEPRTRWVRCTTSYDGTPTSPADVEVEVEVEPEEPPKASSPLKLKLKGKATSEEVASASSAKADSKPSGSTVQRSDGPSYEEFCHIQPVRLNKSLVSLQLPMVHSSLFCKVKPLFEAWKEVGFVPCPALCSVFCLSGSPCQEGQASPP